jgi:hypothetical protein
MVRNLLQAEKEVGNLKAQLSTYDKDKLALTQTKARLQQVEKQLKNLEWEHEVGCPPQSLQAEFLLEHS